jgi:hypothetical protein
MLTDGGATMAAARNASVFDERARRLPDTARILNGLFTSTR